MRKLFYILGVAVLVPVGLAAAIFAMLWVTNGNNVSVNVNNNSSVTLRHVVVSAHRASASFNTLSSRDSAVFSADPRFVFDVTVAFDANNRHYNLRGRAYLLPFGDFIVTLSIDRDMKLSVSVIPI